MNGLKSCISLTFCLLLLLAFLFGEDVWNKGWIYWNTNWTLKEDYDYENQFPRAKPGITIEDYLPGGHFYKAVDWREPKIRDQAEITFNQMIGNAGLGDNLKLRPWREAMKRNGRYDLRRQVELLYNVDQRLTVAKASGGKFEVFANLAVFGVAVAAGVNSESPYQTARATSEIGTASVSPLSGFWTKLKANSELRILAGFVFLPRGYGQEPDPTHSMTVFLKSFDD